MTDSWYQNLQEKTLRLLRPNSPFRGVVEAAFFDDHRPEWVSSLTHPSLDPESDFESREFVGDKIWSSAIALYLKHSKPNITAAELTNGNTRMSNNRKLASIYNTYGLTGAIILPEGLDDDDYVIVADAMEAYLGTLYSILMKVKGGIGAAFFIIYEILETVFGEYSIESLTRGSVADMINGYRANKTDRSTVAFFAESENSWEVYTKTVHYKMLGRAAVKDERKQPIPDGTREVEIQSVVKGSGWMDDHYDEIEKALQEQQLRRNKPTETNYAYNGEGGRDYTAIRVLRSGTHSKKTQKAGKEVTLYIYTVFGVRPDGTLEHLNSRWIPASSSKRLVEVVLKSLE